MAWKRILFDLDGTLTDPATGIVNSILHALNRMGIPESDPAALTQFVGPPLHESFATRYGLSTADAFRAVEYYREYFTDRGIFENRVYPEIPDQVSALAASIQNQQQPKNQVASRLSCCQTIGQQITR